MTDHARVPFGSFFGDEEYFLRRSMWLRNVALEIPIHRADLIYALDDYSDTSQLHVLAALQIGRVRALRRTCGIALPRRSAPLFRLVRPTFGATPSARSGAAAHPAELFAWSISALKEPLFVALTATALATPSPRPGRRWARQASLIASVLCRAADASACGIRHRDGEHSGGSRSRGSSCGRVCSSPGSSPPRLPAQWSWRALACR
jgi:hypothetical protein